MKQLILHIGSPKTGSSSIQLSLNMSKKLLIKNNFIYFTKKIPHSPWVEPLNSNFFFQDGNFEENITNFTRHLNSLKTDSNIIISSEVLWNKDDSELEFFFNKLSNHIKKNIKIIAYIRRQDYFAISGFNEISKRINDLQNVFLSSNQLEKNYRMINGDNPFDINNSFVSPYNEVTINKDFYYYKKISALLKYVDKEKIFIRNFDRKSLKNQDVVDDFYHLIGIDKGYFKGSINTSFNEEKKAILKFLIKKSYEKKFNIPEHTRQFIISFCKTKKITGNSQKRPSRKDAESFYSLFRKDNKKLNELFKVNDNPYIFDERFDKYPEIVKEYNPKINRSLFLINSFTIVPLNFIARNYYRAMKIKYYLALKIIRIFRSNSKMENNILYRIFKLTY